MQDDFGMFCKICGSDYMFPLREVGTQTVFRVDNDCCKDFTNMEIQTTRLSEIVIYPKNTVLFGTTGTPMIQLDYGCIALAYIDDIY